MDRSDSVYVRKMMINDSKTLLLFILFLAVCFQYEPENGARKACQLPVLSGTLFMFKNKIQLFNHMVFKKCNRNFQIISKSSLNLQVIFEQALPELNYTENAVGQNQSFYLKGKAEIEVSRQNRVQKQAEFKCSDRQNVRGQAGNHKQDKQAKNRTRIIQHGINAQLEQHTQGGKLLLRKLFNKQESFNEWRRE